MASFKSHKIGLVFKFSRKPFSNNPSKHFSKLDVLKMIEGSDFEILDQVSPLFEVYADSYYGFVRPCGTKMFMVYVDMTRSICRRQELRG